MSKLAHLMDRTHMETEPKDMPPFQVAIIGFGRIADTHLEAWKANEGIEVNSICDDSPLARERARSLGLRAYETVDKLLKSEALDAVSICTPPSFHPSQAIAVMNHGVAVLCEKPLAMDLESAQTLIDAAAGAGVEFQLATKFRHVPEIRKARDLITHGVIGDPLTFHVEFCGAVDMQYRWNSQPTLSGGGVLIDNGCHAVDTVRFLLNGGINKIQGIPLRAVQKLPVEDSAMMLATTESGATGKITLSWSMKSWSDTYISVQGTRGMIQIGWKKSYLHVDGEAPVEIGDGYSKLGAHKRMMAMFRDLVRGSNERWISNEDALASSTVIEAAYRSMQTSRWARVPAVQILRPAMPFVVNR
jgi:predicted dehydrogenase